ncbi:MAG: 16S rRNA (adenine(1518)-N(6)/adenine(1519)-N(6))-dimethyltransferase RsmA [Nitrospinota bacterium]
MGNSVKRYPKRRLGQNFLVDDSVVEDIIRIADIDENETILEIGPGKGILTYALAKRVKRVIALELDKDLCGFLKNRLVNFSNIEIIHTDALTFDYRRLQERFRVISNLPYYVSVPIMVKLLEKREIIPEMLLMLQKEVANRITSQPGIKDYGSISVFVQYFSNVEIVLNVTKESFRPIPKVDSAVVRITPLARPLVEVMNEDLFFRIVRYAFALRRKTLRNSLKAINIPPDRLKDAFRIAEIDPSRRGETLSLQEFANLSNAIV